MKKEAQRGRCVFVIAAALSLGRAGSVIGWKYII